VNGVKKRSEVGSLCSLEKKGLCLCGVSGEEMQRNGYHNLPHTTSFYFRISETNASKRILSVPPFSKINYYMVSDGLLYTYISIFIF